MSRPGGRWYSYSELERKSERKRMVEYGRFGGIAPRWARGVRVEEASQGFSGFNSGLLLVRVF